MSHSCCAGIEQSCPCLQLGGPVDGLVDRPRRAADLLGHFWLTRPPITLGAEFLQPRCSILPGHTGDVARRIDWVADAVARRLHRSCWRWRWWQVGCRYTIAR